MPVLAHRWAKLYLPSEKRGEGFLPFEAMGSLHGRFGVLDTARCLRITFDMDDQMRIAPVKHQAPAVGCTCGFYSFHLDVPGDGHFGRIGDQFELLVELKGTIVEHERGYRAQQQRVLEVRLRPCNLCGEPSGDLLVQRESRQVMRPWHRDCHLAPTWTGDAEARWEVVSAGRAGELLGVQVVSEKGAGDDGSDAT